MKFNRPDVRFLRGWAGTRRRWLRNLPLIPDNTDISPRLLFTYLPEGRLEDQ